MINRINVSIRRDTRVINVKAEWLAKNWNIEFN